MTGDGRTLRLMLLGVFVGAAALTTGGCRAGMAPVLEMDRMPLTTYSGAPLDAQATRAILRTALDRRGWVVVADDMKQRVIQASIRAGGHEATIQLDYDGGVYSIWHVASSRGLKYNGRAIHRRYNNWVSKLDKTIRNEVRRR